MLGAPPLAVAQEMAVAGAISTSGPYLSDAAGRPRLPAAAARGGEIRGETIRVVVRSRQVAAISSEINARISHLPQREGDRFRQGDLLVGFDCRRITAEYEAAQAAAKAQRAAFEAQLLLQRYKAAGSFAVQQSRFELEKAEAELRVSDVRRTGCSILAPFDGQVVEKSAHVHEIAQPNQPLLRIANGATLELVLMVPSSRLARVTPGMTLRVRIDETGEQHAARIVQATGQIDPISQSARLIAEFAAPAANVLPGMSGSADLGAETRQP